MALVVITGGARSGKSSAAEELASSRAAQGGQVAVAVFGHSAHGEDAEYAARIAKHVARRPDSSRTIEYTGGIGWMHAVPIDAVLVVECLGTCLGRVMEEEWERLAQPASLSAAEADRLPEGFEAACTARMDEVVAELCGRGGDTIVVTNEVGDGIVPAYASGRLFRDLLGRANHSLTDRADAAYLAVAGRLLDLNALPRRASWPQD